MDKTEKQQSFNIQRIDWVDIFKALAILLMVVGHATGKFNGYIYQFHMAAFFFISGYTSNLEHKTFMEVLIKKTFSLLFPLVAFIIMGSFALRFIPNSYYSILFDIPFFGLRGTFFTWLKTGDLYIQFLGATWFLVILFEIFIFQKCLLIFFKNKLTVAHFFMSIIFLVLGYLMIEKQVNGRFLFFTTDLLFIGQFYFVVGLYLKHFTIFSNLVNTDPKRLVIRIFALSITAFILILIKRFAKITVDYPSRKFQNIFLDSFAGVNGSVFLLLIAQFLEKLPKKLKKLFLVIGKNTIGIVFLHFIFFKLIFCIAYKMGFFYIADICKVVPPSDFGNKYYLVVTLISVIGSCLVWFLLTKIPILNFCIGVKGDKYNALYKRITLSHIYTISSNAMRDFWEKVLLLWK